MIPHGKKISVHVFDGIPVFLSGVVDVTSALMNSHGGIWRGVDDVTSALINSHGGIWWVLVTTKLNLQAKDQ